MYIHSYALPCYHQEGIFSYPPRLFCLQDSSSNSNSPQALAFARDLRTYQSSQPLSEPTPTDLHIVYPLSAHPLPERFPPLRSFASAVGGFSGLQLTSWTIPHPQPHRPIFPLLWTGPWGLLYRPPSTGRL